MEIFGDFSKIYHVSGFSRPVLPTTLNDNISRIVPSSWKLLPFWVKNEAEAAKYANTLNADSGEIFEKKSYSRFILKYRGVLWVDAFFEPHTNKATGENENYLVYTPSRSIFPLGIVYAPWTNQDTGEVKNTFSVVTIPANPFMEEIHNEKKRMPLVLTTENMEKWMMAKTKEDVQSFFKPYEGDLMAHKTFRVTAARGIDTNVPGIQDEIK